MIEELFQDQEKKKNSTVAAKPEASKSQPSPPTPVSANKTANATNPALTQNSTQVKPTNSTNSTTSAVPPVPILPAEPA